VGREESGNNLLLKADFINCESLLQPALNRVAYPRVVFQPQKTENVLALGQMKNSV
jgi:hypothetical protein